MKKRLFLLLLLCPCLLTLHAQSARSVLDATAARMTQSGCVRAQFKVTQFKGTTPESEFAGTMLMLGRKFRMEAEDIITWFDGKTQWSMIPGSGEVNISEPSEEELATMNPYALINLYKKGYRYSLRKSTLRGKPTYEVHLMAKSKKASFIYIYVDVDQATYNPLCFRAKQNGNWLRLSILSFLPNQKTTDTDFTFPAMQYPNVEVIDLR